MRVTAACCSASNHEAAVRVRVKSQSGFASVTSWITDIRRIWAHGTANTLELARLMCVIRNQSLRGEWTALWKSGQIPFGRRKGHMLLRIASGWSWANVQTFALLPTGWSILHELARLDRQTLEQLIHLGFIHPKLTLREAKELVARSTGKPTEGATRKANVRQWLRRSVDFVRNTVSDWEPDERELATEQLTRFIEQIAAAGGMAPMR